MRFLIFVILVFITGAFAQFESSSSSFKLKRQAISTAGSERQSAGYQINDHVGVQNFGRMKNSKFLLGPSAGVFENRLVETPDKFALKRNFPNPFNAETIIQYTVPQVSHVTIAVYSILGQQLCILTDSVHTAGVFTQHFNGRDDSGRALPSGLYLIRMTADSNSAVIPVSLVR